MKIAARPAFSNKFKNPYNWLLYRQVALLNVKVEEPKIVDFLFNRYDIVHLHWPEYSLSFPSFFQALYRVLGLLIVVKLVKFKGAKLIWTIHNLRSHENLYPELEAWFWQVFIKDLDAYICLSHISREKAIGQFPNLKDKLYAVTPHGHYRSIYPNNLTQAEARRILEIAPTSKVLVFVGAVRPYKNLLHLIKIFCQISNPDLVLLIAGNPNSIDISQAVVEAAEKDSRIKLFLNLIPDEELQIYFNAANLTVIPYTDVLNSGTTLLSLSFNRPLLVPNHGSLQELQELVGETWIRTYHAELTSIEISKALCWVDSVSRPQAIDLNTFEWSSIAQNTVNLYVEALRLKSVH